MRLSRQGSSPFAICTGFCCTRILSQYELLKYYTRCFLADARRQLSKGRFMYQDDFFDPKRIWARLTWVADGGGFRPDSPVRDPGSSVPHMSWIEAWGTIALSEYSRINIFLDLEPIRTLQVSCLTGHSVCYILVSPSFL